VFSPRKTENYACRTGKLRRKAACTCVYGTEESQVAKKVREEREGCKGNMCIFST